MQTIKLTLFMVLGLSIAFCTKGTDVVPDPEPDDTEKAKIIGAFFQQGGNVPPQYFSYKDMDKWKSIFDLNTSTTKAGDVTMSYIGTDNPDLAGLTFKTTICNEDGTKFKDEKEGTFIKGAPSRYDALMYLNYPEVQGHVSYVQLSFTSRDGIDHIIKLPLFKITKNS